MAGKTRQSVEKGRTGRGVADIAPDRLRALNDGTASAATLTECLAVDFAALMRTVLSDLPDEALDLMEGASAQGISRRMALAGRLVLESRGVAGSGPLRDHPSDTVRGWACFTIGAAETLSLEERLEAIRPLADDPHFGVREWAWLAVRPHLAADLDRAIALLSGWTAAPSGYVRRFASEAIRPRGVWCAHIASLKSQPDRALPVLTPLRADPDGYVQDSVGNWLNDASKDQPDWVRALCAAWQSETPGPATARICKRALRTIGATG